MTMWKQISDMLKNDNVLYRIATCCLLMHLKVLTRNETSSSINCQTVNSEFASCQNEV